MHHFQDFTPHTGPRFEPSAYYHSSGLLVRYDDINVAVESNLRKQAEVMHGIDANMQAFGDILQQNASSQQVCAQQSTMLTTDYAHN